LDVFTDFKKFSICFEYDNDLTKVQIAEIEKKWFKVDTKKTKKISVEDNYSGIKGLAANPGMTKLHDVYFDLVKKPLAKAHYEEMNYDKKDFTVSLEDFKNYFKKEYDEKLPTVQISGATYLTVLFHKEFLKSTKIAKRFQKELLLKTRGAPAREFQYPTTGDNKVAKD